MKALLVALLFLVTAHGSQIDDFAKEANYLRDFSISLASAKKEQKVLMLVVIADFCPWCKKLERKTLSHQNVAKKIEQNFIPLIMDKEWDKKKFPKEFQTKSVPSLFFIEPREEKEIYRISSYENHKVFEKNLDKVLKLYQEMQK